MPENAVDPRIAELQQLFHYADRIPRKGVWLAHYTSANVAQQALKSGQIWLTHARDMNDSEEIRIGRQAFLRMATTPVLAKLKATLDLCAPGMGDRLVTHLWPYVNDIGNHAYIACACEHDKSPEIADGRLSMWRGYALRDRRKVPVAIVLHADTLMESGFSVATFRKVVYQHPAAAVDRLSSMLDGIRDNAPELRELLFPEQWWELARSMLFDLVLTTKHPGFYEECEWRLIALDMDQATQKFRTVRSSSDPRSVIKLPLIEGNRSKLPQDWVAELLVGPMFDQERASERLSKQVAKLGITVRRSTIPYVDRPRRLDRA